jgi:hypothetical protein
MLYNKKEESISIFYNTFYYKYLILNNLKRFYEYQYMLSYSNFNTINYLTDPIPESQRHNCERTDTYTFVRQRLGNKMVTSSGEKFGPFLYRNCRNGVLISSWDKPIEGKTLYKPGDIGMYSDALIYYKNE